MTIIGCMAAYQEGESIGRALMSIVHMCNRIIVVDGARVGFPLYANNHLSTDNTLEVAKWFGAEIITPPGRPWHNQIEQRNAYLAGDPGDWYLIVDADEVVHGALPDLTSPLGCYKVRVYDRDRGKQWCIRLLQEDGTLRYQFAHYGLYRQGRLVGQGTNTSDLWIDNSMSRSAERWAKREEWVRYQHPQERARLRKGRLPEYYVEVLDVIKYRFVGNGRYVPGIPARDILEEETKYHAMVEANIASKHPVYERAAPASHVLYEETPDLPAEEPLLAEMPEDQAPFEALDEELPAGEPDNPTARRKSRKEQIL